MVTCYKAQGAQLSALDDLEGWDGGWSGKEVQEGGDICLHMADSLVCTAETNITL